MGRFWGDAASRRTNHLKVSIMRVFVLGGTGTVGYPIVLELRNRSHTVVALSRSPSSDERLRRAGATPFRGDLSRPTDWAAEAASHDAIVQAAATFDDDMGMIDEQAIAAVMQAALIRSVPLRLLYTGGCWLYGQTGDAVANENRPFAPLPCFSWMVERAGQLLQTRTLSTAVVHPAIVYDGDTGGAFADFLVAARAGQPIEIWGSADTRWPLIESSDLARAYCDLVERSDLVGHFNAVAETGVPVGRIATVIGEMAGSTGTRDVRSVQAVVDEYGAWAQGPTLDQQMSAAKLMGATAWRPRHTDFTRVVRGLFKS